MYRFTKNGNRMGACMTRVVSFGLSCVLAGGCALISLPASATSPAVAAAASALNKPDPEVMLIEVYKALGANDLRRAMAEVDKLVEYFPNFRLGQLIRGDVLLMHTRPVTTLGAVSGPEDKLKNLREEAKVRLQSLRERPDPDLVPRAVLQLREDQHHVLVVDAKRSRLYVYENRGGELKFVADYYVSQGRLGVNKMKAGDQKTPVGVYYITSRLPGERLPDFYGSGALPINYPNEWDKVNGRSGSGIWLHGTPSDSYSRPPLSSDGCVVLTNPDLYRLSHSVEIGKTPVVISESVEFVNRTKWRNERNFAAKLIDNWRHDLESLVPQRLLANYSSHFKSDRGEDLNTWFAKHQQSLNGVHDMSVNLKDLTFFLYPGRDDMIVSTFTQETTIAKGKSTIRKRQYWAKESGQWKIVYETNL
jgi:murein L,D-transpeptidase YafK